MSMRESCQKNYYKIIIQITFLDYCIYSVRLTIIVSLSIFLFLKMIVTLEYQCNIYFIFFPLLYLYLLNFIQLNYSTNYN